MSPLKRMDRKSSTFAGWIIVVAMLSQLVPLGRVNLPAHRTAGLPSPASRVLYGRCGQCHSNATRWPASAYVAPLSWYVVRQVKRARQAMNLSEEQEMASMKTSTRRLLVSGNLSTHASIPGFTRPELTGPERKALLDWSAEPDNELPLEIKNSGARPASGTSAAGE
jgi:hypothetical protein